MTKYAEPRVRSASSARTAEAVAAGHDAELRRALASVSWERRGPLGVLSRRPRPQRIPGTAD
jgi:hypothetical protein